MVHIKTKFIKEKETGAFLLMSSGDGNWCSTVLGRRAMATYAYVNVFLTDFRHSELCAWLK